ncbi:MAG: DNA-binding protein [Peptococcaceae bacterium]|nr:DNA-binding protein [Peptococcaceae bacterium]
MYPVSVARGRTLIGRLKKGDDLLDSLTRLCMEANIRLGKIQAIGAVSKAVVGFYLQEAREYVQLDYDYHQEIISLQGNVSIKDGQPFIHAHLALSDGQGKLYGGHLMNGTVVFACEYIINEYIPEIADVKDDSEDQTFTRALDEETGLYLWPKERIVP